MTKAEVRPAQLRRAIAHQRRADQATHFAEMRAERFHVPAGCRMLSTAIANFRSPSASTNTGIVGELADFLRRLAQPLDALCFPAPDRGCDRYDRNSRQQTGKIH